VRPSQPVDAGVLHGSSVNNEQRLRREQVARVQVTTDLKDIEGQLTHGETYVYDFVSGRLIPVRPVVVPPFSYNDTLTVTTSAACPPHLFEEAWTSRFARATVTVTGSSNSVFALYKNGTSFATLTVGSGSASSGVVAIVESFAAGDVLTTACTTAGTGAGFATVKLW
jgi:hypothetical protein